MSEKKKKPGLALWLPLILFAGFFALVIWGLVRPADREVASAFIGKPLPAFDLPPATDDRPGLATAVFKAGKPRLLNVFASWCVPCAVEAPQLAALAARGVEIDGVAIRDHKADVARFLAQNGNPFARIGKDDLSEVQLAIGSSGVLLSWSRSMFEYLMPPLLLKERQGGILNASNQMAVDVHIDWGRARNIPWGVSESAFNARDRDMNYQYYAFGVPTLALKRSGGDYVVAPYASILAAQIRPQAAVRNLATLRALGAEGPFGFYDAVDFAPNRLRDGQGHAAVGRLQRHVDRAGGGVLGHVGQRLLRGAVQREADERRHLGGGVGGVDGERHEHREHLRLEVVVQVVAVVRGEVLPRDDLDAGIRQRGLHEVQPRARVAHLQRVGRFGDVREHVLRGAADVGGHRQPRHDAALEARHADHEELIEVRREDREEVGPLEHRQCRVLRQLQHPLVEREPAELAVHVAVVGQLRVVVLDGLVEVVVVGVAEARVQNVGVDHPFIMSGRGDRRVNPLRPATAPAARAPGRPRRR